MNYMERFTLIRTLPPPQSSPSPLSKSKATIETTYRYSIDPTPILPFNVLTKGGGGVYSLYCLAVYCLGHDKNKPN